MTEPEIRESDQRVETCIMCDGYGYINDEISCDWCDGYGRVTETQLEQYLMPPDFEDWKARRESEAIDNMIESNRKEYE